jgi:hypothetical protein
MELVPHRARQREWTKLDYARDPGRYKLKNRKSYVKNRDKRRQARHKYELMRKYGLTVADYDRMFEAQGGVCKICKKPETRVSKTGWTYLLAVDHDKITMQIGGLLCAKCNKAIGVFDHNEEWLSTAASYIKERNLASKAI